jgi:hypothetical protein
MICTWVEPCVFCGTTERHRNLRHDGDGNVLGVLGLSRDRKRRQDRCGENSIELVHGVSSYRCESVSKGFVK